MYYYLLQLLMTRWQLFRWLSSGMTVNCYLTKKKKKKKYNFLKKAGDKRRHFWSSLRDRKSWLTGPWKKKPLRSEGVWPDASPLTPNREPTMPYGEMTIELLKERRGKFHQANQSCSRGVVLPPALCSVDGVALSRLISTPMPSKYNFFYMYVKQIIVRSLSSIIDYTDLITTFTYYLSMLLLLLLLLLILTANLYYYYYYYLLILPTYLYYYYYLFYY